MSCLSSENGSHASQAAMLIAGEACIGQIDPSNGASFDQHGLLIGRVDVRCLGFSGQSNSLFFKEKGGHSNGSEQRDTHELEGRLAK